MEEKNIQVSNYIMGIKDLFEKNGYTISEETVKKVMNQYMNSMLSFDEIKTEIDQLVAKKLDEIRKRQELMDKMKNQIRKSITDLPVETKGITLNMQQIDLINIVSSKSLEELSDRLNRIINLSEKEKQQLLSSKKDLESIKRDVFDAYQKSLTPYIETYFSLDEQGKNRELNKRINFILNNANMTDVEKQSYINIVRTTKLDDIPRVINETFEKSTSERIFSILSRFMPTEKEGIRATSYESFVRLHEHLKNYQVINIDELAKYGHYVRADGSFNREGLEKMFDFAKEHNMQTRLNTLLFYMDIPDRLESLPKTQENIEIVKQTLKSYVEDISSFIGEYNAKSVSEGKTPTIRTVEVMNELLNRFSLNDEISYLYRGQIDTDEHRISRKDPNYDNLRAGWLRFLNIEDLCEIMHSARLNMPNVNCMINECTLEDPRKLEPFKRIVLDKIRTYEQQHGIKIIDSIGTQMHIDSNVSKENMINMFEKLGQFGLPVEVTEFDMTVGKDFIATHTPEEIEALKQQKLNDFCDVIVEMKEKGRISGVTIWSVSDLQNFEIHKVNEKIYLQNLERMKNGLDPLEYVKTLYGGYYDENMKDRTKEKRFTQNFNYHTHTFRSGHSEYCTDEEILMSAKQNGISMLGFSEHIPNPDIVLPEEDHRMLSSETEGYISSINKMKQKHPEMTILSGFEAEYDPMKEAFLGEMREKVDYMILGQHFVPKGLKSFNGKGNPNYPIEYANMVVKAIDSGLFDIVAHPDIFMEFRDTIQDDESKKLFEENSVIASQIICEKARDMGIPIEINLGSAENNDILSDGNLAYPHPTFWKVSSEIEGLKVVKGIDAHHLKAFENASECEILVSNISDMVKEKLIEKDFNPKIARQTNSKLQEAYKKGQESALTFETHMVNQIMQGISSNIPDGLSLEDTVMCFEDGLNSTTQGCVENASKKDKLVVDEISMIADNPSDDIKQIKGKVERKRETMEETNKVLANQQRVIENAKGSVVNAMNIGCETKEEFTNMITQITQYNTTQQESQKIQIENHVSDFQNKKLGTNIKNIGHPYQLKRVNNNQNSNNNSSGFINTVVLSLIVTFVIGLAVGIGYMLYKFSIGG